MEGLKKRYRLVLVTATPEDSIKPILELMNLEDLFDEIYKSPLTRESDKKGLLKEFIEEEGKPVCYICDEVKDVTACKHWGIASVLVTWDGKAGRKTEKLADYSVKNVKELKEVIKNL